MVTDRHCFLTCLLPTRQKPPAGRLRRSLRTGLTAAAIAAPALLLSGCNLDSILMVNDTNATGSVGDARLSLTEAILLASGNLNMKSLSAAERKQIRGATPGKWSRDLIQIGVGKGEHIVVSQALPLLKDMAGDYIDGQGAVLTPAANAADPVVAAGPVLKIASSQLVVSSLNIEGFVRGFSITPQGVRDIHNVSILDNRFKVADNAVFVVATDGSGSIGTVRDIEIAGNTFEDAPASFSNIAVSVIGQALGPNDSATEPGVVSEVSITDNKFGTGFFYGVSLTGTQTLAHDFSGGLTPGIASRLPLTGGGELREITIAGNRFAPCGDTCIVTWGGSSIGANLADGSISGLRILQNDIVTPAVGIYMIGGYTFIGGVASNNAIRNVEILDNTIRAAEGATCTEGLGIVGTYTELANETASSNGISRAVIARNRISGCHSGMFIRGGHSGWQLAGTIQDNAVSRITIAQNKLTDNEVAMRIAGGVVRGIGAPNAVAVVNNAVDTLNVDANRFATNSQDIVMTGADASDTTGSSLVNNAVRMISYSKNVFADGAPKCLVTNDLIERATVTVDGNLASNAYCP